MIALFPVSVAFAADGDLDTGLDTDGKVTTNVGRPAEGNAVAVQTDGKIVVAGTSQVGVNDSFAVVRYTITGTLDTSFGTGGAVNTAIGLANGANAVAIQTDGKIVVAGWANNGTDDDFAVARYTITGTLDTDFNTTGTLVTPIPGGTTDRANAVAIQADGKIVVAGTSLIGGDNDFVVVRYNTNGSLDTSFNTIGIQSTDFGAGADDQGNAVAIQTMDGKIVVAGTSNASGSDDFAMTRYNTNGTLDPVFDTDGRVTTNISTDQGNGVAIQTDGKIVVAGRIDSFLAVVRYNTNGSLDSSFDGDGILATVIGATSQANGVAIQTGGKIVVAGTSNAGAGDDFALARYTISGTLDASFGAVGVVTTTFGVASANQGNGVAIQTDGKIVVAGTSNAAGGNDFAVARYNSALATTTTLTSTPNPSAFGQIVVFTATVSSGTVFTPTAAVTLTLTGGITTPITSTLSAGGQVTFTTSALPVGTHSITATYSGNANFLGSTASLTQTVTKAGTTTALTSVPNPSVFGQGVVFTATVIGGSTTPTGTVTFTGGITTPITSTLSAGGQVTLTTSALLTGTHVITATYSGNANYFASISTVLTQTVTTTSMANNVFLPLIMRK